MSHILIDKHNSVTINRLAVKNAVDGPTAAELADALRAFESDAIQLAAVLTRADGTFCAGASRFASGKGRHGNFSEI